MARDDESGGSSRVISAGICCAAWVLGSSPRMTCYLRMTRYLGVRRVRVSIGLGVLGGRLRRGVVECLRPGAGGDVVDEVFAEFGRVEALAELGFAGFQLGRVFEGALDGVVDGADDLSAGGGSDGIAVEAAAWGRVELLGEEDGAADGAGDANRRVFRLWASDRGRCVLAAADFMALDDQQSTAKVIFVIGGGEGRLQSLHAPSRFLTWRKNNDRLA